MAKKKVRRQTRAKRAPVKHREAASTIPEAPADPMQPTPVDESAPDAQVTIVGIGMSAGGLEACRQVLEVLPESPGLAIVLIPHLAPHQTSSLAALLGQHCKVPVSEATTQVEVQTDHIYVIPPDVVMDLADGVLHMSPRPPTPQQTHPIDSFLTSLASMKGEDAIAVILSGTGSDGSLGVRNIKNAGGTVIVQRPDTAKYSGMPEAAIGTGLVDLVLPPGEIGQKIVELARLSKPHLAAQSGLQISDEQMAELTDLLRHSSGVDFSHYKQPTLRRRILRRMAMNHVPDVGHYLALLAADPKEIQHLYQDILIHVTRFFREPESFAALAQLIPKLLDGRPEDLPLRLWVAGCATGEEVYSVAMTVFEAVADGPEPNLQIFGTDVSESAVEFARQGIYPATIAEDVPAQRLRRFFTRMDGGYRISKTIRDRCVFARQDITKDPPFSRLDLIVCRNVLIYMDASLQRKVTAIFHYALKANGYLMLGQAETTGAQADYFTLVDKKHRIYRKRPIQPPAIATPISGYSLQASSARPSTREPLPLDARAVQQEASRTLLERYGPPGVLVNDALDIVQFRGHTGPYLEPPPGDASFNLLKLAREGLMHGLRSALQTARKSRRPVRKEGLTVRSRDGWVDVNLEVIPLVTLPSLHFLVTFETAQGRRKRPQASPQSPRRARSDRVVRVEEELATTREYLQSVVQEVEAANEELQSANEEILSSNEELQSTNEELDTAKEELQSTNEELNTLNEELHSRNEELTRSNSDLVNLLANAQIAIVIVSVDLRIRRFTPAAEKLLNLIPSDIGRPITQINPNINLGDLGMLVAEVVDRVQPIEREVKDANGRWFVLRVRPYKGVENRIEGAVLAVFDIDPLKLQEIETERTRRVVQSILDSVTEPVAIVDAELRIHAENRPFREAFQVAPSDGEGRFIYELRDDGSMAHLRSLLERVVRENRAVDGVELRSPGGSGDKTLTVNAHPLQASHIDRGAVLVAFQGFAGSVS
jgi:two-component system, chemotaxis family, CheB/CheR fusion protein